MRTTCFQSGLLMVAFAGAAATVSMLAPALALAPSELPSAPDLVDAATSQFDSSRGDCDGATPEQRGAPWQQRRRGRSLEGVFKHSITPHWFADNSHFWYRNDLRGGQKEFVLIDAEKGVRKPAFDHERLASALSDASKQQYEASRLPFDEIELINAGKTVQFTIDGTRWQCALDTYQCVRTQDTAGQDAKSNDPSVPTESAPTQVDNAQRDRAERPEGQENSPRTPGQSDRSPDGMWTARVCDHNVYVRSQEGDKEIQLSSDGTPENAYGRLEWAPDSKTLVAFRIEPVERKEVYLIESSPTGGGRAKLTTRPYELPGDKYEAYELNLFDVAERKQTKPNVERIDFGRPRLHWKPDGRNFIFEKIDRGHQRFRLIQVESHTGDHHTIIDEQTETFIWTAHTENLDLNIVNWLDQTDEIIYVSERDGWRHLYLLDGATGQIKNQLTKGQYVVRGVDKIDEQNRQVWFHASGKNLDQDPYLVHYYCVNFDGTGLVSLTEADGNHQIEYSPDRRFLIDTYSRVDLAPESELRRVSDATLVCELERADISKLSERAWQPPEVFTAKGRDGKTDIWGIICRPPDLDPAKSYPIIEDVYAGPQSAFVPKSFSSSDRYRELTDLGFVVVKIDGMGTAHRSKAFHDVCWKNLKDGGFPDRILWIKAAAAKYPYMDTSRVGIYGVSAGGQNAAAAVLFYGDFYKAAVASCGCHDNRMDKASWNEQWMGYPVGPAYAECSNIDNADRLQGQLMLIVGEMDTNVPPESTMRFVDALVKADKDFDLVVLPGAGHTSGGDYGRRRLQDFFVRHLANSEPAISKASSDQPITSASASPTEHATLDLTALAPQPSRIRNLTLRFEADHSSLNRYYSLRESPARHARMKAFYTSWLAALQPLTSEVSPPDEREDLERLTNDIRRALLEVDDDAKTQDQLARHVPFASTIIQLAEARQRVEDVDARKTASVLEELANEVQQVHVQVRKELQSEKPKVSEQARDALDRSATSTTRLRSALKEWFDFYNGYDPTFSWWMREPFNNANKALETYEEFLNHESKVANEKDLATDGPRERNDVPELRDLIGQPAGQMQAVIERFQSETRRIWRESRRRRDDNGRSRGSGRSGRTRPSPQQRARAGELYASWLEGLEQLDFDNMNQHDRVDYLLLANEITYRLEQLKFQPDPPEGDNSGTQDPNKQDPNKIVGRPVGRDALLVELAHAMIPYTPEELIEIANKEYAWCEAELVKASREMGLGDDWRKAVEKVKSMHVEPGEQPKLIRDLAREAIEYVEQHELVTVPPLASETWRMQMMSPERQLVNPFFTGGEVISVSFPTDTMSHESKLQSMRGNNIPFARATVHHELIPGHHLQAFMTARYRPYRRVFATPFWGEGWALYWEMLLYDQGFAKTPADRVGFLVWRAHRCARIMFSISFHLGQMSSEECIDLLVDKVGFDRNNAAAEIRRSVEVASPLYQAAYMLGGLQFRALSRELVQSGKMTSRQFHDSVLRENSIPVEMLRAILLDEPLTKDFSSPWRFYATSSNEEPAEHVRR